MLAQDDGIIYEVNGETFPLKPGDLLFIWPGELHAVSTINREHRLIMLQLDADFWKTRGFPVCCLSFYQIRLLNQNNFPEIEKLRGFLTELRRLSLSGISFLNCADAFCYISFYSARRKSLRADRNCRTAKTGHSAQVHRQMVAACTWISSHCTEPVSLEEASKVAGFSRCHFPSCSAHTPASPSRISSPGNGSISPKPVKKPDLTITEVSLESGFNSISTFNRVF